MDELNQVPQDTTLWAAIGAAVAGYASKIGLDRYRGRNGKNDTAAIIRAIEKMNRDVCGKLDAGFKDTRTAIYNQGKDTGALLHEVKEGNARLLERTKKL